MPTFFRQSDLPVAADVAFAWHARPGAFERLIPPWQRVEVVRRSGLVEPGARLEIRMWQAGIPLRMVLVHKPLGELGNLGFVDEQVEGPFRSWRQHHRIVPTGPESCRMEDEIHWEAPSGTTPVAKPIGDAKLTAMFRYRHRRLQADLRQHDAWAGQPRRTFAISGSTGLIGEALVHFLTTGGHRVRRLVRRDAKPGDIAWDPRAGTIDAEGLAGCDAVVHLAGESIFGRWTAQEKEKILRSRVDGTALVARALASLPADRRPKVLVSGSAVGWYGSRGDESLTEESAPGTGFLADVCRQWERAADPARDAGIRVVHPRTGIVLSGRGGALVPMKTATRLCVGGPLGSGRQYMSWIAWDDMVALLLHLAMSELDGAVNATAPTPAPQREVARALGRVLGRPAFLPLPAPVVRAVAGEMGQELLLDGQRVAPEKALASGFRFELPDLDECLRHEIGARPD